MQLQSMTTVDASAHFDGVVVYPAVEACVERFLKDFPVYSPLRGLSAVAQAQTEALAPLALTRAYDLDPNMWADKESLSAQLMDVNDVLRVRCQTQEHVVDEATRLTSCALANSFNSEGKVCVGPVQIEGLNPITLMPVIHHVCVTYVPGTSILQTHDAILLIKAVFQLLASPLTLAGVLSRVFLADPKSSIGFPSIEAVGVGVFVSTYDSTLTHALPKVTSFSDKPARVSVLRGVGVIASDIPNETLPVPDTLLFSDYPGIAGPDEDDDDDDGEDEDDGKDDEDDSVDED